MTSVSHPPPAVPRAIEFARQILHSEATALHEVADRLDFTFVRAVDRLAACRGRVAVSGVGKSADVGAKIVGTMNSPAPAPICSIQLKLCTATSEWCIPTTLPW